MGVEECPDQRGAATRKAHEKAEPLYVGKSAVPQSAVDHRPADVGGQLCLLPHCPSPYCARHTPSPAPSSESHGRAICRDDCPCIGPPVYRHCAVVRILDAWGRQTVCLSGALSPQRPWDRSLIRCTPDRSGMDGIGTKRRQSAVSTEPTSAPPGVPTYGAGRPNATAVILPAGEQVVMQLFPEGKAGLS